MGTGTCGAGEERALRPHRAEELGELSAGCGSPCAGVVGEGRWEGAEAPRRVSALPSREQQPGSPQPVCYNELTVLLVVYTVGEKEDSVPCKDHIKVQFQCSQVRSYGPGRSPASSVTGPTTQGQNRVLVAEKPRLLSGSDRNSCRTQPRPLCSGLWAIYHHSELCPKLEPPCAPLVSLPVTPNFWILHAEPVIGSGLPLCFSNSAPPDVLNLPLSTPGPVRASCRQRLPELLRGHPEAPGPGLWPPHPSLPRHSLEPLPSCPHLPAAPQPGCSRASRS